MGADLHDRPYRQGRLSGHIHDVFVKFLYIASFLMFVRGVHWFTHDEIKVNVAVRVEPLSFGTVRVEATHMISKNSDGSTKDSKRRKRKGDAKGGPKVFFLKTHKTGASTVQNIVMRYGYRNGLKFAIPQGPNFNYPRPFQAKYVRSDTSLPIDIVAHYQRLNVNEFEKQKSVLFGKRKNVKSFTMLRDPATLIGSIFGSLGVDVESRCNGNLTQFLLEDPFECFEDSTDPTRHLLRNGMSFDFGFKFNNMTHLRFPKLDGYNKSVGYVLDLTNERDKMDKMIRFVENSFDLVMLGEHFDESLVLLKNTMGWTTEDIIYASADWKKRFFDASITTTEEREAARIWAYADSYLYQHFNRIFWNKVEAYGVERMENDLAELRERVRFVNEDCFQDVSSNVKQLVKYGFDRPQGPSRPIFNVIKPDRKANPLCRDIARSEKRFSAKIFKKQFPKLKVPYYFTK